MTSSLTTTRTETTGTVHVTAEDDGHVYLEATPADDDAGRIAMRGTDAVRLAKLLGTAARETGYEGEVVAALPLDLWDELLDAARFSIGGRGDVADNATIEAIDELRLALGLLDE